jgi:hypothetical protein
MRRLIVYYRSRNISMNIAKLCPIVTTLGMASALLLGTPGPTRAAIINGGFETGDFTGWSQTGATSIRTSSYDSGPTEGSYQALIINGSPASGASVPTADLEAFLGLTAGTLSGLGNGTVTEGSAIKQGFSAAAGQVLSFDWNFLTNGGTPGGITNDFAFFTLNVVGILADSTFASFITSPTHFGQETTFQTFSTVIPTSGNYQLGLGVVDVFRRFTNSGLLVDNVRLSGHLAPEPGSMALLGLGIPALMRLRRRCRR